VVDHFSNPNRPNVAGLVLAGGLSRRMHGPNKAELELGGQSLVKRAISRLSYQVQLCLVNGPDKLDSQALSVPRIADTLAGNRGPLAGILAAMEWLETRHSEISWLVTVPCDTPFFPFSLVECLLTEQDVYPQVELILARSADRLHPVVGLWSVRLRKRIAEAMSQDSVPRLLDWINHLQFRVVDFEAREYDPFFNINRPEDYDLALQMLKSRPELA